MYHNRSVKEITKSYNLLNTFILNNWITVYKKKLEKGAVTLVAMDPAKKKRPCSTQTADQTIRKGIGKSQRYDLRFECYDRLC